MHFWECMGRRGEGRKGEERTVEAKTPFSERETLWQAKNLLFGQRVRRNGRDGGKALAIF